MKYETLLQEAASDDIYIIENADFKSDADALINGDVIGISKNVKTTTKRTCVLAEELGHYYTTIGNILNQSNDINRKQEEKARLWAYDKLLGLESIVKAYKRGCKNLHEMAEELEVTEPFLSDMLHRYKSKYGLSVTIDNYTIFFEPYVAVLELV